MFNSDKTQFWVDLNDERTLAMKGDGNVKFANVVSSNFGMTMTATIEGGTNSCMEILLMIFKKTTTVLISYKEYRILY